MTNMVSDGTVAFGSESDGIYSTLFTPLTTLAIREHFSSIGTKTSLTLLYYYYVYTFESPSQATLRASVDVSSHRDSSRTT
jgi:hypothetical protein